MRTQSILRRLGALSLAVVMTLSLVTMPALAEENPDTGDTLVEDAAPVTTGGEGQPEGEVKTDGGEGQPEDEVKPSGEGQPEGESKTDGGETPVETTQATEAPVETTQATEAPTETTQATEAPTENPEPTETTEAPTEAPTETTEATEAPTETTEVTEPTETTEDPAAAESAKRVAEVQAMIDALRTEFPEEEWEAEKAKYDAVTAALAALTEEEKGKLNLERYLALGELIQSLPVTLDEKVKLVKSFDDLVVAITNGGDVVLGQNITLKHTIEVGKDNPDYPGLNLDLGTFKIDTSQTNAFDVHTSSTVKIFNGEIENTSGKGRCIRTGVKANLVLEDLKMTAISEADNPQPLLISYNGAPDFQGSNVSLNSCEINAGARGYAIDIWVPGTTLTVSGEKAMSGYGGLIVRPSATNTVVNISDAIITTTNDYTLESESSFATFVLDAPSIITINGGRIETKADNTAYQYAFSVGVPGVTVDARNTKVIIGGTSGTARLVDQFGYKIIADGNIMLPGDCTVQLKKEGFKVVNGKVMPVLDTADELQELVNLGGEVVLEGNITLSEPLVIPQGKSVTLNLNGFTLENSKDFREDSLVIVDSGASLVVTGNGIIRSSLNGIKMTQDNGYDASQTASLVMESGTVEAKSAAIIGNGRRSNTSITINGGTLKGDGGAIYHPQQGKVVINGGTLTGGEFGVEMRAGNLTVNGGTITATSKDFNIGANGNGSTTQGVAVAVVPYSADRPVTVTINNGKLEGQHALHQEILKDNTGDVTLAVNGGTFTGEVVAKDEEKFISGGSFSKAPAENLAVENWSVTQNPDGSFGVKEDPFILDQDGNKEHVDPSKPLVLDELLEKNKEKDAVSLTISADAQVNKDHGLSGTLLLETQGHRITGSGSIRTGKKLELKDFGSLKTRVTLPEGGKLVFKDGRVQVLPSERTNDDHEGVGYSVPVIITVGDSTYTYFLSMDPDNAGKIVLDETGKPLVLGQYYSSKGDDAKAPEFTFVYISSHGTYYLGRHTDMTFVSNAPIPSMDYITIDGDPVEGKYLTEPDDEDTASVTLSYRFLRNLDTGKHTIRMYFKDDSRAKAEFSVRKTSVYDPENPKTGDTIFLPLAVMTLSAAALAVLMPRKKKYL